MAKRKSTPEPKSPLSGRWRIVSMSQWEEEYLDEEVQAYIEFIDKGGGSFQFGYIEGTLDYREGSRDGQPAVEFSWEGGDNADGTALTGRGWAAFRDNELHGMIVIHEGEESEFKAKRP